MAWGIANARKRIVQGLVPALKCLPPRQAARLVAALGQAEYCLSPPYHHRFATAVRRSSERIGAEWAIGPTARRLAGNHARWHARDNFLDGLSDAQAEQVLTVVGREHLESALARNQGVVLLFNHFGPFLMPAHWLVRYGYPLRWFTERPRHISRLLSRTFSTEGPLGQKELFVSRKLNPNEGGAAIRRAMRMLKANMIVQLAGDVRWNGTRCAPGRFLGRDYSFTTTWVTLAARTGAPVVPVFAVMCPDGTCRVEFLPPESPGPEAAEPEGAAPWVQRNLDRVEDWVRRHPDNSLDYFFWTEDSATPALASAD